MCYNVPYLLKGSYFMRDFFEWIFSGPPIIIAAIVMAVSLIVLSVVTRIMKKALRKTKLDVSLQSFFVKTTYIIGFVLMLICALSTAGISTTGLIAGFSAAGAAVALQCNSSTCCRKTCNKACGRNTRSRKRTYKHKHKTNYICCLYKKAL